MSLPGGLYLRSQATRFVILFIERDGSTYLTSLLMSHPRVRAVYERFAVMKNQGRSGQEQLEWAQGFFRGPWIGRSGARGFKTKMVDVLDQDGFAHLLKASGCRIIQMHRRNYVKAVVSKINARRLFEKSGKWNLYNETDRMPPLAVDPDELDQLLFERALADRQLEDFVENLGQPTIKIAYEDLLLRRDAVLTRTFGFLKIPDFPVRGKTLKHTSDDLRDVLVNFEELREPYRDTEYGAMFDERVIQDGDIKGASSSTPSLGQIARVSGR